MSTTVWRSKVRYFFGNSETKTTLLREVTCDQLKSFKTYSKFCDKSVEEAVSYYFFVHSSFFYNIYNAVLPFRPFVSF